MRKADALKHFGSERAIAEALGVTTSAVAQWGPAVPELSAYRLEIKTDGALKFDPEVYKRGSARQQAIRARARRERRPDSPRLPA